MGQRPHPGRRHLGGRRRGLAIGTALSLAAAPFLTGCSTSLSAATTTLRGVLVGTVVHTDGSTQPAANGLKLKDGDVVRTGDGGRAELVTRDRVVYVGSRAAVQVVDGAHQVLRAGAVVVDAQRGDELRAQVAGLAVTVPAGSAVRAERSFTSRIATLVGSADVTSTAGRHLSIRGLHQAIVGGDALPDTTTPLRLTDDDGEARAVPDLVRDDQTLNGLARGMDATGPSTAHVVAANFSGSLDATRGVGRSERLLPAVIAATGSTDGARARYQRAVDFRIAGGSWGVVARLLGVRASRVVATLAAFERSQPPGQIGNVAAVLATAGGVAGNGAGDAGNTGDRNGGGGRSNGNGGGGGDGGGGGGSPSPSPSPSGPVDTVVDTVDKTVGDVLSLVPTPSPSPTSAGGLLPVPLPTVNVPALPTPH
jgi:hypothetical protein